MFCYVNSVFAPGLDEGVGALWRVSSRSNGDGEGGVEGLGGRGGKEGNRIGSGLTRWAVLQDG